MDGWVMEGGAERGGGRGPSGPHQLARRLLKFESKSLEKFLELTVDTQHPQH